MLRVAFAVLILSPIVASAQEWTRFRGDNGTGVSTTAVIPHQWSAEDYTWKTPLPGKGHSSPVLWGDRIFVTSADMTKRYVTCVDAAKGTILWKRAFDSFKYKTHARNSMASSTPVVDARHLYLLWATPKELSVLALDHNGKDVWHADLGAFKGNHGIGVSPIVYDDLVIVPNEQDDKGSLLALDSATGKKRWEIERKPGTASYSTPCVYQVGDKPPQLIFTQWKHGITAVDPKAGKVAWEISVFEPDKAERAIVSPIVAGDLIIGSCGFVSAQKHFVAVRPDGNGQAKEVWRIEKPVAHLPTPVVKLPWIFSLTEQGLLNCIDAKSGKFVWQERVDNTFSASPVIVGDYLYCVADDGEVFVFKADDKYQFVSRQTLGGVSQATPAVANGRMIFRTETTLLTLTGKVK